MSRLDQMAEENDRQARRDAARREEETRKAQQDQEMAAMRERKNKLEQSRSVLRKLVPKLLDLLERHGAPGSELVEVQSGRLGRYRAMAAWTLVTTDLIAERYSEGGAVNIGKITVKLLSDRRFVRVTYSYDTSSRKVVVVTEKGLSQDELDKATAKVNALIGQFS